jgi:hypothetical protein
LGRLRRVPSAAEAARVLDEIGSERRLRAAGGSLLRSLAGVPRRPLPVLDAVLGWVAREAGAFCAAPRPPGSTLRARGTDAVLVAAAALPGLILVAG